MFVSRISWEARNLHCAAAVSTDTAGVTRNGWAPQPPNHHTLCAILACSYLIVSNPFSNVPAAKLTLNVSAVLGNANGRWVTP